MPITVVHSDEKYYTPVRSYDQTSDRRYPIFYIDYRLTVDDCILYRSEGSIHSNTTGGHTNPDFPLTHDFHYPSIKLPPFEVQFEGLLFSDLKKIIFDYLNKIIFEFPFDSVGPPNDRSGELQWRGTVSYPGGPEPRIVNVARNFGQFARMDAEAVPPKQCGLTLWMEDPDHPVYRDIIKPKHWTKKPDNDPFETYPPFVPNGEPLPPRESCVLVYIDPYGRPKYKTPQYLSQMPIPTVTPLKRKRAITL